MYRLYFTRNDPRDTLLVSESGVVHYRISTKKADLLHNSTKTVIERHDGGNVFRKVATVKWNRWTASYVKTDMFEGIMTTKDIDYFLYRLSGKWTPTRYFIGDDGHHYRWKDIAEIGPILQNWNTRQEICRFAREPYVPGRAPTERRWYLQIQNTTLNLDMAIMTFSIMEHRRRVRVVGPELFLYHDVQPRENMYKDC